MPDKLSLPVLEQISVPVPCLVPWDSMTGDDVARHCCECDQTVHDLSAMSSAEAAAFVAAYPDACLRFFKRPDGTVVTRDCQPEVPHVRRGWFGKLILFVFSWLGLSLIAGCGFCIQGKPAPPKKGGAQANPVPMNQVDGPNEEKK